MHREVAGVGESQQWSRLRSLRGLVAGFIYHFDSSFIRENTLKHAMGELSASDPLNLSTAVKAVPVANYRKEVRVLP